MRVDDEARSIEIAIREALEMAAPGPAGPSPLGGLRARWGTRAHERHRALRENEGASGEVPMRLERRHRGWSVALVGRADIVDTDARGYVVEEVKSVLSSDAELGGRALALARQQARLYALALDDGGVPVAARVVVVPVDDLDGPARGSDAGYERAATETELVTILDAVVDGAEGARGDRARRGTCAARLRFPYDRPRPHQQQLGELVAQALAAGRPILAEAPTGIGKTIAALLPALRHALERGTQCFYATSKTTQRQGVAEAFEALRRAAGPDVPLRALTLRRKEQMCPPGDLRCHPEACELLKDFPRRASETKAADRLLAGDGHVDPDAVYELGAAERLCPFELMQALKRRVDLVIGDFNHVYDRTARGRLGEGGEVIVVDEAHNLVDRARGYASPFVSVKAIQGAEREAAAASDEGLGRDVTRLARAIRTAVTSEREQAHSDLERVPVDGCLEQELDGGRWRRLALEAEGLGLRWLRHQRARAAGAGRDGVVDLVERVSRLERQLRRLGSEGAGKRLLTYVADPTGPKGEGVGVICVDPSRELERHHRHALGTVVMSATLSPTDYYAELLGLSRLDPMVTSVPSPFPPENREVIVVPSVGTTYREREAELPRIAELIERIVALRPGNYAAFFPSFSVLDATRRWLTLPSEQILVQIPQAPPALRARVLGELRRAGSPRLLLAVTGGIFAEGVDLPGEALVGAIVVGPTLPPPTFERLLIQRHFEELHEMGFAYASVYPGLRRVVQAAGRVIRSPEDRGVIVLLGRRFSEPAYADCLPAHWYRWDARELLADDPIERLGAFWGSADPC